MPTLQHRLEYAALKTVEAFATALPRPLCLAIGAAFGTLLYHTGVYRRIVQKNFDHVALWTPDEQRPIQKRLYANTGRYMAEFLRASQKLPPHRFENIEILDRLLSRGKGIIGIMAHMGNWEIFAPVFGARIPDMTVVTMPMHNKLVENWLTNKRGQSKINFVYKDQALRKIIGTLRNNGLVALLIDQHVGIQGTPAPFLGKPAGTVRTVAGMVHTFAPGVLAAYALLQKDLSYVFYFEECQDPAIDRSDKEAFISACQTDHNNIISNWIIKNPDHYFGWFHKRFKGTVEY